MRILTLGTFDLLHSGHIELLGYCQSLAGLEGQVIVGLNTDDFVEEYKGKPSIMPYSEREAVLLNLRMVDQVVFNDQSNGSAWALVDAIEPNLIVIGSDWHDREYLNQLHITWDQLASIKCSIVYCPRALGGPSSSEFKKTAMI